MDPSAPGAAVGKLYTGNGRTFQTLFIRMILKGKKSWLKDCFRKTSSDPHQPGTS
jgi:hypothetical protein